MGFGVDRYWQIPPASFSAMLVCPCNPETPRHHHQPWLLSIWNIIPTCSPIQTISEHKHSLKSTLPSLLSALTFHTILSSRTCQIHHQFFSTADENHCADWNLQFFYRFQAYRHFATDCRSFSVAAKPFSSIYPFTLLFKLSRFSFYHYQNFWGTFSKASISLAFSKMDSLLELHFNSWPAQH